MLPPAPIRPTRIFFSDMKQLTFLLTVLTKRLPAPRVRHIFGYGSDGSQRATAYISLGPLAVKCASLGYSPRAAGFDRPSESRLG